MSRYLAGAAGAAAFLAMAGCAMQPEGGSGTQSIEFLRGCWVSKTAPGGEVTGFLRLLPQAADGPDYRGEIQAVSGGQMRNTMSLAFSRDGSAARLSMYSDAAEPALYWRTGGNAGVPGASSAAYAREGEPSDRLIVEGRPERLSIRRTMPAGDSVLFAGERDGCD